MKDKIIQELTGKKVLILGFGREGRSTYRFIKNNNIDCTVGIADMKEITDEEVLADNVALHTGANYLGAMKDYDLVMKTPGQSFKDVDLTGIREKITSQTELFIKYGKNKIIGITGTKGKSTTSSLIYAMLKEKYNTLLVGNIGLPAFEEMESYDNMDYFVYELSSHQLQYVDCSPHIAVLLNMYEDHLDHYKSYEEYKESKRNIYKYQNENDYYIFNEQEKAVLNGDRILRQHHIGVGKEETDKQESCCYSDDQVRINIHGDIITVREPKNENIRGAHNSYNIAVATTVAKLLDVEDEKIAKSIMEFRPLAHRLENIGVYGEVTYIDDSIATIPEAVISAVESIPNINTVIIGGMDRGIHYASLIEFLSLGKVENVILMYDSGKKIYEELKKTNTSSNYVLAEDLEKAVELATQITKKGTICLMSPAAASYGVFKNFEERGDKFKEYVIKYTSKG
ncbi:MAG: UDP-N-acetylmuramoyl-L-alanine--D-glutamate ligase [Clostridia bacterium]|nr:UDP-N-acetylmuramoyl-L-alanine--D-glutamate ligase [Clostridia bacterium]